MGELSPLLLQCACRAANSSLALSVLNTLSASPASGFGRAVCVEGLPGRCLRVVMLLHEYSEGPKNGVPDQVPLAASRASLRLNKPN